MSKRHKNRIEMIKKERFVAIPEFIRPREENRNNLFITATDRVVIR